MGIMVFYSLWVVQDLYHPPYVRFQEVLRDVGLEGLECKSGAENDLGLGFRLSHSHQAGKAPHKGFFPSRMAEDLCPLARLDEVQFRKLC